MNPPTAEVMVVRVVGSAEAMPGGPGYTIEVEVSPVNVAPGSFDTFRSLMGKRCRLVPVD